MEQDWHKLEPFRVNKLSSPGSMAAVKEIAKLLSERAFRHTARLRAALQPLEKLFGQYEAVHESELRQLADRLEARGLDRGKSASASTGSLLHEMNRET